MVTSDWNCLEDLLDLPDTQDLSSSEQATGDILILFLDLKQTEVDHFFFELRINESITIYEQRKSLMQFWCIKNHLFI